MKHTLAWIDPEKQSVTIDYRPVHTYTMTNDIAYIERRRGLLMEKGAERCPIQLPKNSRITAGKTWPRPTARRRRRSSGSILEPDDGAIRARHLLCRSPHCGHEVWTR